MVLQITILDLFNFFNSLNFLNNLLTLCPSILTTFKSNFFKNLNSKIFFESIFELADILLLSIIIIILFIFLSEMK